MSTIAVRVFRRGLHFAPLARLADEWERYRSIAGRLRFVERPTKGYFAPGAEQGAAVVGELQAAGFEVHAEPAALAELQRGAAALQTRAAQGAASVERARERLAERGASFRGEFQSAGVAFLNGRRSALLLDDMGLGKTAQSVLGVDPQTPVVVACPSSVVGAWVAEVERWTSLRARVLNSAARFAWPAPGEVLVLSHDKIPPCARVVQEHLGDFALKALRWLACVVTGLPPLRVPVLRVALPPPAAPPGALVVLDEAHAFKTLKSDRTRNARALVRQVHAAGGASIGLSGTVVQNRPDELRAVLEVLDLFKESFGSWRRFAQAFGGEVAVRSPEARATPAVAEALARVALRRTAEEVLPDLPPLTVETRWVPLAGEAAQLAAEMERIVQQNLAARERDLAAELGRPLTAEEHEAALLAALESSSEVGAISAARKTIALALLAAPEVQAAIAESEAEGEPLVVASPSTDPVAVLGQRLGWARIAGDVPARQRTQHVADFQAGKLRGIAISIRAGGTGLTLTRSARMLMLGRDWNPAQNVQTMKRIHRIGQTRPCRVTVFAADCWVERHVAALCSSKTTLARESLDALVGRAPAPVALPDLSKIRTHPASGSAPPRLTKQEAPQAATTPPGTDPWLPLDDALRRRLERLAATGNPLARWLLATFTTSIPSRIGINGQPRRPTLDLLREAEERASTHD